MNKVISVDWFQYHCHSFLLSNCNLGDYVGTYVVCPTKVIMPNYRDCFEIRDRKNCIICYVGRHSCVPGADENCVSIKVDNAVLYTSCWNSILHDFIKSAGAIIKNITRLDLCCDFNTFDGGLEPAEFIRSYIYGGKINPIRKGSNQFSVIGSKSLDKVDIQTLRFGSSSSAVKVYMYNKTKELEEVKDKPYIREMWKNAGLDVSKVWRVEISISSQGTYLKRLGKDFIDDFFHNNIIAVDNYRFLRIQGNMLKTQVEIERMFETYALEYFYFVDNRGQKYTKDMKAIKLFDFSEAVRLYKPCSLKQYIKIGRTEKVVANKLFEICECYNDLTTDERHHIYKTACILNRIGAIKNSTGKQLEDMFISELQSSESSVDMWQKVKEQFGHNIRDLKLLLLILNNIKHDI